MLPPYKYPPSAVLPIPGSGYLNLVRKLDDGSLANIEGWAHFYDHSQDPSNNDGSGINHPFPSYYSEDANTRYSREWWITSGVVQTYGIAAGTSGLFINEDESGIFHFKGIKGQFTESGTKKVATDFNLFQPYIHHGLDNNEPDQQFEIPYVSDYILATPFRPYPY